MPRLRVIQPSAIVGVDLGHFAWRLELGASKIGAEHALALVYRYPPSPAAVVVGDQLVSLASSAMVALVRARIPMAPDAASVQRVAEVILGNGGLDADKARAEEAMRLFLNLAGVTRDAVARATESVQQVVDAWHWVAAGGEGRRQFNDDCLVIEP
jgi:hypothetical protein